MDPKVRFPNWLIWMSLLGANGLGWEPDYRLDAYHFQLVTPVASEVDPGQICRERVPVARLNEFCGKRSSNGGENDDEEEEEEEKDNHDDYDQGSSRCPRPSRVHRSRPSARSECEGMCASLLEPRPHENH